VDSVLKSSNIDHSTNVAYLYSPIHYIRISITEKEFFMSNPIVRVTNFKKNYGDFEAVKDISFEIHEGEIFALLGPNGAGKTTTLECLEGLRKPTSGIMTISGIDPVKQPKKLKNTIGVQLQSSGLPNTITPNEAMNIFCAYHEVNPRYDLLERIGLTNKRKIQYHQLSTGQQRRLSLALAVAHQPKVILFDEPTAGLDVSSRVELHELMYELKEAGSTIILATHDMAEAEEMSDRVAILLNGEIATIGSSLEITSTGSQLTKISVQTKIHSLFNNSFLPNAVVNSNKKENYKIFFSEDISASLTSIIDFTTAQNDQIIDLRVERPSLEDRFLEITTNGNNQ
jgi:ABC-2 type transport system ATP-binding protein